MRCRVMTCVLFSLALYGCSRPTAQPASAATEVPDEPHNDAKVDPGFGLVNGVYRGFDRNDYPGDTPMFGLHKTFAFTGFWITPPPGETTNTWAGKRAVLRKLGWGFLVLANGRLDKEILQAQKKGSSPAELGRKDAEEAIRSAHSEGFPAHTVLFLDQEEGGRLLDEQASYLLGWTEAVAASGFRPGLYASGQPVPEGPGATITTIDDVRERVKKGKLHEIAMFDAQDACPPAPGCSLNPVPLNNSKELDLTAWQYSQSPRRPEITQSCAATYAADNNCYAPGYPSLILDMDAASSSDPSQGR